MKSGDKFNRLRALKRVENARSGNEQWLFECDCGREVVERTADVVRGFKKIMRLFGGPGARCAVPRSLSASPGVCRSGGASPGAAGATAVVIRVVIVTALVLEDIVQRLGKVCLGHWT